MLFVDLKINHFDKIQLVHTNPIFERWISSGFSNVHNRHDLFVGEEIILKKYKNDTAMKDGMQC
jgi:hypothetical protein